jgi:glucose/arabinose dehydrogenase
MHRAASAADAGRASPRGCRRHSHPRSVHRKRAVSADPGFGGGKRRCRAARDQCRPRTTSTPVGGNLAVEAIASGLVHATDLAVSNEGLLFVAELGGRLRVVQEGRHSPEAVLPIDDVQRSSRGGLLSLALDPQFARTGLLYLVYAFESSAGDLIYRLARFRYADGVLGERAVLLDEVPAAVDNLAASVRFGPDGKLYVAFGDAGGLRDVPSSFNGKVLRLSSDGTTPRDQPSASPVYVAGLRTPRALAWGPADNDLWILDASPDGPRLVRASGSASGVTRRHMPCRTTQPPSR